MKKDKRFKFALTALFIILIFSACTGRNSAGSSAEENRQTGKVSDITQTAFTYWNENDSLSVLQDYVADVTDKASADFIPEEDRIAVFDLDGTLVGEQAPIYFEWMMYCNRVLNDDSYEATPEQIKTAGAVLYAAKEKSIPKGLERDVYLQIGSAFSGMTVEEYRTYTADFLETSGDRFDGYTLKDSQYLPMLEVVQYLQDNAFTVYIVSGTDRDACRVMISEKAGIPYNRFICSDYYFASENQEDTSAMDYQLSKGEKIIRSERELIKNVKMSKAVQMQQELGQKPVLAFGNSSGDFSMFMYTTDDNPYRAEAFCIIPDDDERETAYPEKAESLTDVCKKNGWHVFSMKNDFKTVYSETVTKNAGNNAWLDEMLSIYDSM